MTVTQRGTRTSDLACGLSCSNQLSYRVNGVNASLHKNTRSPSPPNEALHDLSVCSQVRMYSQPNNLEKWLNVTRLSLPGISATRSSE